MKIKIIAIFFSILGSVSLISNDVFAKSAGYELANDFIVMAGSLKQEVMGAQEATSAEDMLQNLGSWIKHSEAMIRILDAGYQDMEKHKVKTYYSDKINESIASLQTTILALREVNYSAKLHFSKMMLPTIQSDVPMLEKQMSEFIIKSSEDSVTIDESYRMMMFFVPIIIHSLVKEENGVMVSDISDEEIKYLKEKIIFYYGDEVKNEPVGQKHIVATGNALWVGLSNLENIQIR